MKPIAIFRHSETEGPGYFATFLDQHRISWTLVRIDAGDPVPPRATDYAGLAFMGGPMSVNDPLPWIPPVLELIRGAVAADVPVIGHCLGGQLLSRALGGSVGRNRVREIGWGEVFVDDRALATEWLPGVESFMSFHWHGETFVLPAGATRLLRNEWCDNQAFVLGPHLGMQCHVEMTAEMIESWCDSGAGEVARHPGPSVQTVEAMMAGRSRHLAGLNRHAGLLYERWIKGLRQN